MKKSALWTEENHPRKTGNHRERGPESFECVTYASIAKLAGVEPGRVRAALRMRDSEKGAAATFEEIFDYVERRVQRRLGKRMTEQEAAMVAGPGWANRWPRFDLWTCGVDGCDELSLESARCAEHGGVSTFRITDDGVLQICVGSQWCLYAEVVTGAEPGEVVEYLDGNKWNLRPTNLRVRARRGLRYRAWAGDTEAEGVFLEEGEEPDAARAERRAAIAAEFRQPRRAVDP